MQPTSHVSFQFSTLRVVLRLATSPLVMQTPHNPMDSTMDSIGVTDGYRSVEDYQDNLTVAE